MSRRSWLAATIAVAWTSTALAGPITTLQDVLGSTNLYVLGNLGDSAKDRYGSASEGRVVVGGDAYTSGFSYGSALTSRTLSLVVGGNLDNMNGGITGSAEVGDNATLQGFNVQGSLTVGGNASLTNGSIGGTTSVAGSTTASGVGLAARGDATPSATAAIGKTSEGLRSASAALGALETNGTVKVQWGDQLVLTGTNDKLNVFSLTAAQVANLSKVTIAAPKGSTVLVNVAGKTIAFDTSFGMELIGITSAALVFNAYEAQTLSMASLVGSLVAPNATVAFAWGALDGAAIFGNLSNGTGNGGAFKNDLFAGTLPDAETSPSDVVATAPQAVPEPWSVLLLGAGLVALAFVRRRPNAGTREGLALLRLAGPGTREAAQ